MQPQISGIPLNDVDVLNTDNLSIICAYTGRPAPSLTWLGQLDGFMVDQYQSEPVGPGRVTEFNTTSELQWAPGMNSSLAREKSGNLTCIGSNEAGTEQQTFYVNVQCKNTFPLDMTSI